jgi:hypothetical protein
MTETFIPFPPTRPGQKITEFSLWIAVWKDGSESIMGANGMPIMHSIRQRCEVLGRPIAERVREAGKRAGQPLIDIKMRTFRIVEEP